MQAITALETIRSMFNSSDPFTANARDHVFATVRATIVRDADRTIHSLSADGWQPTDLALLLLTRASSLALSSGHYHIYRGVLGGEGHGYLTIFRRSVKELVRSGFITPQEAEADIADLTKDITEVG